MAPRSHPAPLRPARSPARAGGAPDAPSAGPGGALGRARM